MEIVIAITIILSLTTIVLTAGKKLIYEARKLNVIYEKNLYSKAIAEFYNIKSHLPGDILKESAVGDLNVASIINNIEKISNGGSTSQYIMNSGHVTAIKSITSFQQLAAAGLISANLVDLDYNIQGSCLNSFDENLNTVRDKLIPVSKYIRQVAWVVGADSAINLEKLSPKNSIIYNEKLYSNSFEGRPRLILFRASNYNNPSAGCEIDVNNQSEDFLGSGAISANFALDIDLKIDNGKPGRGNMISENDIENGCTDLNDDIYKRNYIKNDIDTGRRGCITTFAVDI